MLLILLPLLLLLLLFGVPELEIVDALLEDISRVDACALAAAI